MSGQSQRSARKYTSAYNWGHYVALLGLQLLVRQHLMLALLLLRSGCWACSCWCVSGPHANACWRCLLRSGCWACSYWCVSGPHANACAGAACCALAVGPAATGACLVLMLMLVLALLVALWLLGLQLLVRVWSSC
jgi:hypothetical protein